VSTDPAGQTERPGDANRPAGGVQRWGGGMTWRADPEDRPGEPACLLPRVRQACGAVTGEDPPGTCPRCGGEIPGG
jgi:hypothetical protein